jgi:alanine racemase
MRPVWAEISLTNLQHNFATIRDYVAPNATVCAIVKANAYGHGLVRCAQALQKEGAKWFGVTSADEGVQLRKAGITGHILLCSGFWRGEEEAVVEHHLTPVVWEWNHVELLENAAEKLDRAPESVPVHLKIDTGMSRLGIATRELAGTIEMFESARAVYLDGVMTHLASAEVSDAPDVEAQIARFDEACAAITEAGLHPTYYHLANSAAICTRESAWKNMVRPGIGLYGYFLPVMSMISGMPDHSMELPVLPVLSWKTRIMAIRDVGARQPISYNGSYVTQAPARIAVLPVGYADGLCRQLSSRGRVIVRGDFANMVGTITMDMTMIDVTGMPGVDVGDEVILIGESGKRKITAWDLAGHAQTIPYEVLCAISARVPRVYVD